MVFHNTVQAQNCLCSASCPLPSASSAYPVPWACFLFSTPSFAQVLVRSVSMKTGARIRISSSERKRHFSFWERASLFQELNAKYSPWTFHIRPRGLVRSVLNHECRRRFLIIYAPALPGEGFRVTGFIKQLPQRTSQKEHAARGAELRNSQGRGSRRPILRAEGWDGKPRPPTLTPAG